MTILLLKVVYFVFPIVAIGSVVVYFLGYVDFWVLLLFPVCGFGGIFAGGLAQQLEARKRNVFTFRAGDPVSIVRAAFYEIESRGDLPGLSELKDEVLSLIDDRERTVASITEDRLDPKGLVYLLITNIANARLCSGRYHIYRGILTAQGKTLENTFVAASRHLVDRGVHDQHAHESEVSSLRKELSEIG